MKMTHTALLAVLGTSFLGIGCTETHVVPVRVVKQEKKTVYRPKPKPKTTPTRVSRPDTPENTVFQNPGG